MTEDAEVLAALARVHDRVDPVPAFIREAARAAFARRDPEAMPAELVDEDLLSGAGLRAIGGPRLLTFAGAELRLDLEVREHGSRRRLLGQLSPAGPGRLRAQAGDRDSDASVDALGRFVVDDLAAGPFRLRWEPETGPASVTSWITL